MRKVIFVIFLYSFILFPGSAFAEDFSVGVAPAVTAVYLKPGRTVNTRISVENFSDDPVTLEISFREFVADGDTGRIRLIENSADFSEMLQYISLQKDGTEIKRMLLSPRQKSRLVLAIRSPEVLPRQDFAFTVLFSQSGSSINNIKSDTNTSKILGGIGANILLHTGNPDDGNLILEEFSGPGFLQGGPVDFRLKIRNPGNHFISPSGSITIYNMFGQAVGKIPLEPVRIFAGKSRLLSAKTGPETAAENRQTVHWNEKFLAGTYRAELIVRPSEQSEPLRASVRFSAFPVRTLLFIGSFLLFFVFVGRRVNQYLSVS